MKNIQVTDEMHDFLIELSKEMISQDPRGTRMPHLFQVAERIKRPAHDGNGDRVIVNFDYGPCEIRTVKEALDWIKTEVVDVPEDLDLDDINDVFEFLIDDHDFSEFWEDEVDVYSNAFFTAKACEEHIRINGHNLINPRSYLNHANRNKEMEMISKFLCELTGGKLHT